MNSHMAELEGSLIPSILGSGNKASSFPGSHKDMGGFLGAWTMGERPTFSLSLPQWPRFQAPWKVGSSLLLSWTWTWGTEVQLPASWGTLSWYLLMRPSVWHLLTQAFPRLATSALSCFIPPWVCLPLLLLFPATSVLLGRVRKDLCRLRVPCLRKEKESRGAGSCLVAAWPVAVLSGVEAGPPAEGFSRAPRSHFNWLHRSQAVLNVFWAINGANLLT